MPGFAAQETTMDFPVGRLPRRLQGKCCCSRFVVPLTSETFQSRHTSCDNVAKSRRRESNEVPGGPGGEKVDDDRSATKKKVSLSDLLLGLS